jgi:predicted nucleic acid-binding protein
VAAPARRAKPGASPTGGGTLLDSSCLVALACAWHEHHDDTRAELERRDRAGERIVLAGHSIVEAYAVLTRLPPPHRCSPEDAHAVLRGSWKDRECVPLSSRDYWELLGSARDASISGGRIYDALIAACARRAGVTSLLTWNVAHFQGFQGDELEIVRPALRG